MSWLWSSALTLAGVVTLAQGCALMALFSGLGRLWFRRDPRYRVLITEDGPALESELPTVEGHNVWTGEPLLASQFLGRKLILLFVAPDCEACDVVLAALRKRWQLRLEDAAFLIVVSAPSFETRACLHGMPKIPALADPNERIFGACAVERTPFGLLVDPWGYVRMKGIVNTQDQLAGLIEGQGRSVVQMSWAPEG